MSNRVWVVWAKELREIFRDGRSRFNLIISPLLITPLLLLLVNVLVKQQLKDAKNERIAVGIVAGKGAEKAVEAIQNRPGIDLKPVNRAEAEEQIKKRKLKAAVVFPNDADESLRIMRPVPVAILIDEGSESSQNAAGRLKEAITDAGQKVAAQRLRENALSIELAIPFETKKEPIKGGGNVGLLLLSTFLPYMLAVYAIMGGVGAANDSVAGEKERGTLETLLVSAISRRDLVMGKFLAITTAALVSSFLSVLGLFLRMLMPVPLLEGAGNVSFNLSPLALVTILLVQLPLSVLGAGLLLTISTYARNQKEAQTYLAPVLLLVTVAAMMSMFLKADSGIGYAFVPILNAALVLKASLDGTLNGLFVAIACVTSLIYAGVALVVAVSMFEKESVLLKA